MKFYEINGLSLEEHKTWVSLLNGLLQMDKMDLKAIDRMNLKAILVQTFVQERGPIPDMYKGAIQELMREEENETD